MKEFIFNGMSLMEKNSLHPFISGFRFRNTKWAQRKLKEQQFEAMDVGKVNKSIVQTVLLDAKCMSLY